jgi:hypothetical protein
LIKYLYAFLTPDAELYALAVIPVGRVATTHPKGSGVSHKSSSGCSKEEKTKNVSYILGIKHWLVVCPVP